MSGKSKLVECSPAPGVSGAPVFLGSAVIGTLVQQTSKLDVQNIALIDIDAPAEILMDDIAPERTQEILRESRRAFAAMFDAEKQADLLSTSVGERPHLPPGLGEALIVLLAPKNRVDPQLGDLAERFAEDVSEKGRRRAKLLYWARVLRSVCPLLWTKVRNAGLLAVVLELGRRWIS